MVSGIAEIAIVILIAAVLGIIAKLLGQPPILAYLVTGAVVGYFGLLHLNDIETFHLFSDLGIMFLLFLVGLEINYSSLKRVGKTSLIVGLGQVALTGLFGFLISYFLGFGFLEATYLGITLTFSSTIIIVQLLSSNKVMNSLYGKLSVGFLLVQDFVALLLLIALTGMEGQKVFSLPNLGLTLIGGIASFVIILFLGKKVFPYLFKKIAKSQELLFLSSLAWLFSLAGLADQLGFSIEIGGFLAGLALANSAEHSEISSRMRPLRDFFMVVFFAILGSSLILTNVSGVIGPVIILSLFVLIGNPLIVMSLMGFLGYRKRVSFLSGVTVAQISEFSLIVASAGFELGHIDERIVAIVTGVGVITITVSTYLISRADSIFELLSPVLDFFEREDVKDISEPDARLDKPVVLIGFHKTGKAIASGFDKEDLLVIDFDPDIVEELKQKGYNCVFGDASDVDILHKIDFDAVDLVVSTIPNYKNNLTLLYEIEGHLDEELESMPNIIVRASNRNEAKKLYEKGADYVMIPELITGHYLGELIEDYSDLEVVKKMNKRSKHILKDFE
ncbi:MAG: cation:proton antiporter [Candidatus Magasanikbacteria bacterium]